MTNRIDRFPNAIFVFGSNLAGRHGKGAALWARQHRGAIYGQGEGRQGQSYAIPTKDAQLRTLPLSEIKKYIERFFEYVDAHPDEEFLITPVGCGLAGYSVSQIAPLFGLGRANAFIPEEFLAEVMKEFHDGEDS